MTDTRTRDEGVVDDHFVEDLLLEDVDDKTLLDRMRKANPEYQYAVRLRRRLLIISILPVLLLAAIAFKLISLSVINAWGASAYDEDRFATATSRFHWNSYGNVVDTYIAPFNEGTAAMGNGHFEDAVTLFEDSLRTVPEEKVCDVRQNLALSYMYMGDAAHITDDFDEARRLYTKAQEAWMVEPCYTPPEEQQQQGGGGGGDSQDQQGDGGLGDQLDERQDQNNQDQQEEQGGQGGQSGQPSSPPSSGGQGGESTGPSQSPSDGGGGGQSPSSSPSGSDPGQSPSGSGSDPGNGGTDSGDSGQSLSPEEQRQQDLEDRNKEAEKERDADRQKNGSTGGSRKGW